MGLNQEFMQSPEEFLKKHVILVSAQRFNKGSGVMDLEFIPISDGVQVSLIPAQGDRTMRGYFLQVVQDRSVRCKPEDLTGVGFFFTDTLTGCQFLAFGAPSNPIIEHNNSSKGGGPDFAKHNRLAQGVNGWKISVEPGIDYHPADEWANVVGVRRNNGWEFVLQRFILANRAIILRKLP